MGVKKAKSKSRGKDKPVAFVKKRIEKIIKEHTANLHLSEERYKNVVDNIGIGVSLISPKMEILTLNAQMRKWFPSVDASKKLICYKAFNNPPRKNICSYCPTYITLKDGKVHEAITKTPVGDKIINYRVISSPIKDKDGNIVAAIEMVEDVTSRKQTEEELSKYRERLEGLVREQTEAFKDSQASYRAMFDSANDAIFVRDIKTYRIVDANNKACEMFCCPKKELIGLGLQDIITGSNKHTLERFKQYFDKAAMGEPQIFEWPVKDKFGREFWAEINVKSAVIGGEYRLLSISRDVTERRQLVEMKDNFINTVSYELRTPLAAIKESIAVVLEGLTGNVEEDKRECLEIAKKNVDRLRKLIDDVLDFQKLQTGKMTFTVNSNDINEVVEEVQRSMISLASKKRLTLNVELDSSLPRLIFDRDKIVQVLTNIVNNAIKFTPQGGITITTITRDNQVVVSVKDTGIGIRKEDIPRLFKKFEQLKNGTAVTIGGTGLGLAISKEIIERHRGKIWAESKSGKGATIHFVLPIKERRG